MDGFPQARPLLDDIPPPSRRDRWNPTYEAASFSQLPFEQTLEPLYHPFQMRFGSGGQWYVSGLGSSVTDGVTGNMIEITGLDRLQSSGDLVAIEADVDANLNVTNARVVVSAASAGEVTIIDGEQTGMRLVIGRVETVGGTLYLRQAVMTAQRIVTAFYNGMMVKVFTPAPSHPDSLPPTYQAP